ncbi:LysE family translocator [Cochlodiniinecator piscidefendens]|uniref:LysE family translocator n=1 Tax=Cochlodiniinecator piscidefendens TaxID=2715756 RepID=UPI00140A0658|nr:LysE family translocator [Cochlodiniinecator piscidefendens]
MSPVELHVLLAFIPAALALNLTPGADMMFCLGQGMRGGVRPSLAASAGISTGGFVHVTIAALGLSAVLATMPWIFEVIRWAGVCYLLYLAVQTLRTPLSGGSSKVARPARAYLDGLLVNLMNPKVILFILAFLPQFVDPTRAVLPQFLTLGLVMAIGGFIVNGLVGVFASGVGHVLLQNPRVDRILRFVSATVFGALALKIATEAKQ